MMDSSSGNHKTEKGGTLTSSVPANGDMFGRVVNGTGETEGKWLAFLVEWLNSLLPDLGLPETASYEDLRSVLIDGTILCTLLNRLRPCSVDEGSMKTVIDCLLTLRTRLGSSVAAEGFSLFSPTGNYDSRRRDLSSHGFSSPLTVEERQKVFV